MNERYGRAVIGLLLLGAVLLANTASCSRGPAKKAKAPTRPPASLQPPQRTAPAVRPEESKYPQPPSESSVSKAIQGRVVGVADGDTITVLDATRSQIRIRLAGIDAPESAQPYGQASKKALSEMVFGKDVVVIPKNKDRYGRTVGQIFIDGRDVNLEMLERGMAWHYKQYDKNAQMAAAEKSAREAKIGLWKDAGAVPPWEWRASEKSKR